jgi:hypothetical protein
MTSAIRRALIAAGRCVECKQPRTCPQVMCDPCRAIKSQREIERRAARRAAGYVKPKGWNGLQARKHAIYRGHTPEDYRQNGHIGGSASGEKRFVRARAKAVKEARAILADLRQELRDDRLTLAATDVLHRLYERAYELGYAKAWRQLQRGHDEPDADPIPREPAA